MSENRKGWSKARDIHPIDADTFLARAVEEENCEVVRMAERFTAHVHWKPLKHVASCEHPHNDCYCETHWHDGEERVKCGPCVEKWDERGVCHECGHWSVTHCNVDGLAYCNEHYPEDLR